MTTKAQVERALEMGATDTEISSWIEALKIYDPNTL
jgi:alkylhydroperoxidase/carboxymuconolactone decarboxylase family protein YurZ